MSAVAISLPLLFAPYCSTEGVDLASAYYLAFGREPDVAGMNYWLSKTELTTYQKMYWIMQGDEAADVTVSDIYRRLLDREPDPAGLAYWTDVYERSGIHTVLWYILKSAEWKNKIASFHRSAPGCRDLAVGVQYERRGNLHVILVDHRVATIDLSPNVHGPATINAGWFEYTPGPTPRGMTVYDYILVPSGRAYTGDVTMMGGDGWTGLFPRGDIRWAVTGHPLLFESGKKIDRLRLEADPVMKIAAPRSAIAVTLPITSRTAFIMSHADVTARDFQAQIAHELDVWDAVMLDGGGSSQMYLHSKRIEREGRGTRNVPWYVVVLP